MLTPQRCSALLLTTVATAATTTDAVADELGERGQIVLSCPLNGWTTCVNAQRDDTGSYTGVDLAADGFVRSRWSIGLDLAIQDYRSTLPGSLGQRAIDGTLRVGRVTRLGDRLSVWPQLGIGRGSVGWTEPASTPYRWSQVIGRVALVMTPVPHVLLGLAPEVTIRRDEFDATSTGLQTEFFVGAYF